MHRVGAWLVAIFLLGFVCVRPAQAQSAIEFTAQSVSYQFGESLAFAAEFAGRPVILEGYVFYQVGDDERIWVYEGDVTRGRLDVQVSLEAGNQPQAFSVIRYWFRIASDHGEFFESPQYSLYYDDNRFEWQQAERGPFTLYWHSGQAADATRLLAAAQQGVASVQALLPLPPPHAVTLRVYNDSADVERIAQLAHYPWATGHMQPGHGVLLFALGADVEPQVAHEVAHLMLYNGLGAQGYANLPAWLNEGFARLVSTPPDGQQAALLQAAEQAGALLPLYTLCQALPADVGQAHLAGLQSAAIVQYLVERFNKTGFGILVEAYARTGDCINAPQEAFGVDLLQLELDWRTATFAERSPWPQVDWRTLGIAAAVALAAWMLTRLGGRDERQL